MTYAFEDASGCYEDDRQEWKLGASGEPIEHVQIRGDGREDGEGVRREWKSDLILSVFQR